MREILSFFRSRSRGIYFYIVILGIVNSLFHSGILTFISTVIGGGTIVGEYDWVVLVSLILLSYFTSRIFQLHLIRLTRELLFEFEIALLDRVRSSFFEDFEKVGREKIYTAIDDVLLLGRVPEAFVNVFNSLILIVCCMGYMFWVSIPAGFTILGVMFALLIFYLVQNRIIEKDINEIRNLQNVYYRLLQDLILGFKQVKMNTKINTVLFEQFLTKNRLDSKFLGIKTSVKYMNNELLGQVSWYLVLSVILFALPAFLNLSGPEISTLVVIILYMIGPTARAITFIPMLTRVKIALQRLSQLEEELDSKWSNKSLPLKDKIDLAEFQSIRLSEVTYKYGKQEDGFQLGPLNIEISSGELLFVIGGNGSGKSTFVNLLTGLYSPKGGHIMMNEEPITFETYSAYSNQIAAVFSNHYLFSENYNDFDFRNDFQKLDKLIKKMGLNHVVEVDPKENKLITALSQGQSKRLALIYALMEGKKILVLDEWAAEQDPEFRKYFYETIVPELQNQGKTIIVITHDDKYFSNSDRIIKFDFGKVVSDYTIKTDSALF